MRCGLAVRGAAVATAIFVAAASPAVAASDLVGEWHLDASTGTSDIIDTFTDSSGSGNDLTVGHGIVGVINDGRWGGALRHNELVGGPARANAPALQPAHVTVMAWVRRTQPPPNGYIVAQGANGCQAASYALEVVGGQLQFYVWGGPPAPVSLSPAASASLWDGNWHSVAGTYDGSRIHLYVDGHEVGSGTAGPVNGIDYALADRTFELGDYHSDDNGVGCGPLFYPGDLDEVRVYDRALTSSEVGSLQTSTAGTPPELPTTTFPLTVSKSGRGSGLVSSKPAGISCGATCSSSYPAGATVTLTAGPGTGSAFGGWSGDCSGTGPCTVVMSGARHVTAAFTGGGGQVIPHFRVLGKSHTLGHALLFDASSTITNAGGIADYTWITGTPTSAGASGSNDHPCGRIPRASLSFSHSGVQTVTLQVRTVTGQTASVTQRVAVTGSVVNKAFQPAYDCENPGSGNQIDRPGCVKTFGWGVVQVNSRGRADDCFELRTRNPLRQLHGKALAAARLGAPSLGSVATHATIKGPIAIDGLYLPVPESVPSEFDDWDATIQIGKAVPIQFGTYRLVSIALNTIVSDPDPHTGLVPLKPNVALSGDSSKSIGALPLDGTVDINLSSARNPDGFSISKVKLHVKLPSPLPSLPVDGYLESDNENGAHVTGFQVGPFDADILPGFAVKKAFFKYVGGTDQVWSGGADIYLPGQPPSGSSIKAISPAPLPGINFSPPPPDLGIGFKRGRLDHFGIGVNFIDPFRPVLFPGVNLTNVHLAFGNHPIRFTGGLGIEIGQLIGIDGDVFVAFASPSNPYTFPNDVATGDLSPLAGRYLDSFSLAIGGDAHLDVPVAGSIPLANAWMLYEAPDYFQLASHFDFKITLLELKGDAGGWLQPSQGKFSLGGDLSLCLNVHVLGFDIGSPCLGNGVVVSSRGLGGCATVLVPTPVPLAPAVPVTISAGYTWDGSFHVTPFSCDLSDFTESNPRAPDRAGAAQATRSFRLGAGLPSAVIRVTGSGGPPLVTVHGPGGRTYPTAHPPTNARQALVMQYADTTEFAINHPMAGAYTLTADAGSHPIRSVAFAHGLPNVSLKARVTGRGRTRILRYSLVQAPGRTVTFVEHGARTYHVLGAARGSRGSIRFTPGTGRRGLRAIVGVIEERGIQSRTLTVAHYRASGPQRPPRPAHLKLSHRGFTVTASWSPAVGATGYEVVVEPVDGGRETAIVRAHRANISGIEPGLRGKVLVTAVSPEGLRGRSATARFRATKVKGPRR